MTVNLKKTSAFMATLAPQDLYADYGGTLMWCVCVFRNLLSLGYNMYMVCLSF